MPALATIALGSNLGDRRTNIESAVTMLRVLPHSAVLALSPLLETAPVGMPAGEPNFLNAAALLETSLPPRQLMGELLRIEREHGRQRAAGERWGPRTLDLDLLTYADLVLDEPGLTLPHPRMHQRLFVLEPLAAIAPALTIPTLNRTVAQLLAELRAASGVQPTVQEPGP